MRSWHIRFPWTKKIYDTFCEEAMLSPDEKIILEAKIRHERRIDMSLDYGMSISKIDKIIHRLKIKYDDAQKSRPDELPKRVFSSKEIYK